MHLFGYGPAAVLLDLKLSPLDKIEMAGCVPNLPDHTVVEEASVT